MMMEIVKVYKDSYKKSYGEIAQLVEQSAHIRSVEGPSPPLAKILASARIFFCPDDNIHLFCESRYTAYN